VENDTVEICLVQIGSLTIPVVGSGASVSLCKTIEKADPYGGIPFVKKLSLSYSEALETMQHYNVINGLKIIKMLKDD